MKYTQHLNLDLFYPLYQPLIIFLIVFGCISSGSAQSCASGNSFSLNENSFPLTCVTTNGADGTPTTATFNHDFVTNTGGTFTSGTDGIDDVTVTMTTTCSFPNGTNGTTVAGACLGSTGINSSQSAPQLVTNVSGGSDFAGATVNDFSCANCWVVVEYTFINGFTSTADGFDIDWSSMNGSTEGLEAWGGWVEGSTFTAPAVTVADLATYCNAQAGTGLTMMEHITGTAAGAGLPAGVYGADVVTGATACPTEEPPSTSGPDSSVSTGMGDGVIPPNWGLTATDVIDQVTFVYLMSNSNGTDCDGDGLTLVNTSPSGSLATVDFCVPAAVCDLVLECVGVINETCAGDADGSITITATSSNTIQYSIDGGATLLPTGTFTDLTPGTYMVYVQDMGDPTCNAMQEVTIFAGTDVSDPIPGANVSIDCNDPAPDITAACAIEECTMAPCAFDPATMNISISLTGTHTFVSDMTFSLEGPAGCGSPLFTFVPNPGICNSGDDFTNLTFTNNPADGDFDLCAATTPLTGSYSSVNGVPIDWSPFAGCDITEAGWMIIIGDCVFLDMGELNQVVVTFSDGGGACPSCLGAGASVVYDSGAGLGAPIADNACLPADGAAAFAVAVPPPGDPVVTWYNAATGGTAIGTGSPFNVAGTTAEEGAFDAGTSGTYTYYTQCECPDGCTSDRTAVTVTVGTCCMLDVTCPTGPVALQCIDDVPALTDAAAILAEFTTQGGVVVESCNPVEITVLDVDDGAAGCMGAPRTVTRTFTVTDPVTGETQDCPIDYVIMDTTPPTITCPGAGGAGSCAPVVYISELIPDGDSPPSGEECPNETITISAADPCGGCAAGTMVDISGWEIDDNTGGTGPGNPSHIFPAGTMIPVGGSVTLACDYSERPGQNIWNNTGDDATLHDAAGNLIDLVTYNANPGANQPIPGITAPECEAVPTNLTCTDELPPVDINTVMAMDNCSAVTVTHQGDDADPATFSFCAADGPFIVNRTYRAADACGNFSECVQTFTFEADTEAPMITCPDDVTGLTCTSTLPAGVTDLTAFLALPGATATDNCTMMAGDFTVSFMDDVNPATFSFCVADGPFVVTRTYTITDACMNASTCDQMFTFEADTEAPMITCPDDVTGLTCTSTLPAGVTDLTAFLALPGATATDNCAMMAGDFTVSFMDDVDPATFSFCAADGPFVVTRTYTITDACMNASTCDQTFTFEADTEAPMITCPDDVTGLTCTSTLPAGVTDLTAFLALPGATATDNCTMMAGDFMVSFMDDVDPATFSFCAADGPFVVTRTYTITDACMNASTCDQTFTFEADTEAPMITCPDDVTGLTCTSILPAGVTDLTAFLALPGATATDNCTMMAGDFTVSFMDDVDPATFSFCAADGPFVVTRTYTIMDACMNASTCDQTFTFDADTEGPAITCPANMTDLVCNTDPLPVADNVMEFIAIGGTIADNCSSLEEITVGFGDRPASQSMLDFCSDDPADRTLTRTYTVTDVCGNTSTCEQTFTYLQSVTAPVITRIPPDQTVDCPVNAFPQPTLFEFETDCALGAAVAVSEPMTSGTAGCPGSTISYTYTVTDVCGRSASHTQIYTLSNDGPEFICPAVICEIDCSDGADALQQKFDAYAELATVNTSCGNDVTITNSFSANGFNSQNCLNGPVAVENTIAWQIVTFSATDDCGRSSSCTALVVIKDTNGPSFSGQPFPAVRTFGPDNQELYDAWINANLAALGAEDECNSFTGVDEISFSPASPNLTFVGAFATTEVTFTAMDACGNESSVSTNFILREATDAPMATVSGRVVTAENEFVENTAVSIEQANVGQVGYQMTEEDGIFDFEVEGNHSYEITPIRNDDPLNGITTLDLIMIGRHVLEISLLETPYQMIAADINNSGTISSLDLIQLRRLLLHIDEEFSNNTSWRFVDASFEFSDPANPFLTTFPEIRSIDAAGSEEIADFVAIKIGDINGSASPNQLVTTGDTRNRQDLFIAVEDQDFAKGETIEVDFKAKDFKEMTGYQFSLNFDPTALELLTVESRDLKDLNNDNFGFSLLNNGVLTTSWNVPAGSTAATLKDDQTLFTIQFKTLNSNALKNVLSIGSDYTKAEAYNDDEHLMNVSIAFNLEEGVVVNTPAALYQNRPNPFRNETIIGFDLAENETATLTIYDIAGKVIKQVSQTFQKGYNEVPVDAADLGATGLLYYRLETSGFTATRKMILLK